MKKVLLLIALCFVAGLVFGENIVNEDVVNEESSPLTYEQAIESGKTSMILFTSEKSCKCTNVSCKKVELKMTDCFNNIPESIAFAKVEVVDNKPLMKKYKVVNAPTILFLDADSNEIGKLQSYEITEDKINDFFVENNLIPATESK